jgi:hypothetical protein
MMCIKEIFGGEWKIYHQAYWINNAVINRNNGMSWRINGEEVNATIEVNKWLKETGIIYPFNDEEYVLFKLRFL